MAQLDDLYGSARAEVFDRRMFWLELIIVVLFAIDLAVLLWKR